MPRSIGRQLRCGLWTLNSSTWRVKGRIECLLHRSEAKCEEVGGNAYISRPPFIFAFLFFFGVGTFGIAMNLGIEALLANLYDAEA